MRVVKYLEKIREMDMRVDGKIAERERILELATAITPVLSDMPKGGGPSDKIGNAAVKLAAIAAEIDEATDRFIDYRAEAIRLLEALPINEYAVLHGHYVRYQTIEYIAENWVPAPKTARQVYRIKAKALRHAQTLLDEREGAENNKTTE